MATDTNHLYRTSDTALASYLITQVFILRAIDYSLPRFEYGFPLSPEIQEQATKYVAGQALTEPSSFNRVNRKLLRIISRQQQWEDD